MHRYLPVLLFLNACSTSPVATDSDTEVQISDTTHLLKTERVDTLVQPDLTVAAEIKITWSGSYCNGAYPPDELLEEIRQPRPLNEVKVILRGSEDYSYTTNSRGRIFATILPGDYTLLLDPENDPDKAPYNVTCEKYYDRSWGDIRIDTNRTSYKIHLEFPCDLCDQTIKMRP